MFEHKDVDDRFFPEKESAIRMNLSYGSDPITNYEAEYLIERIDELHDKNSRLAMILSRKEDEKDALFPKFNPDGDASEDNSCIEGGVIFHGERSWYLNSMNMQGILFMREIGIVNEVISYFDFESEKEQLFDAFLGEDTREECTASLVKMLKEASVPSVIINELSREFNEFQLL